MLNQNQFYFIEKLKYKLQLKIALCSLMEHTYQKILGNPSSSTGLFLIRTTTKNLCRIWAFPRILLLGIAFFYIFSMWVRELKKQLFPTHLFLAMSDDIGCSVSGTCTLGGFHFEKLMRVFSLAR